MARLGMALVLAVSLSGCDPRTWFVCSLGACGADYDQSRPLQPKQVRATGFSGGVALDWAPNPDLDLLEYRVLRSTSASGPFVEIAHPQGPSHRDTGLTNGTTYFYVVRAVDGRLRTSPDSEVVSAAPRASLAPAPPTGLTAVAGDGFVELAWGASFTASTYRVYRGTAAGGPYPTLVGETNGTALRDGNAPGPGTYYYVVTAVNADGAESERSLEASATPGGLEGVGFLREWGGEGDDPGEFEGIADIAVTPTGTSVYVLEEFPGSRVQQFTSQGVFVREWDVSGAPTGIGLDDVGNLYVADPFFERITKYSSTGAFITDWGSPGTDAGQFTDATDVVAHVEVGVLVTDHGNDRVQRFTTNGVYTGQLGGPGAGDGQFDGPAGIAMDRFLTVYVVDSGNHRVQRLSGGSGASIAKWGSAGTGLGQFSQPWGIAANGAAVWVTERGGKRVQVFSPTGVWRAWFGGFSEPSGVAADCGDNVYVADNGTERVRVFGPQTVSPCTASVVGAFASRVFRGSFRATKSVQGTVTLGASYTEKRARQRGTFKLPGAGKLARGRWYALFDVTADPLKATARAKGALLAIGRGRQSCLRFTVDVKDGAVSGRYRGGARGTFRQKLGSAKTWKVTGSGSPGRSSTAACRKVRKAFKLRRR